MTEPVPSSDEVVDAIIANAHKVIDQVWDEGVLNGVVVLDLASDVLAVADVLKAGES